MAQGKDERQEPQENPESQKAPGRKRGTDDSFTGRAAQLAVMAELLRRRCNVAIPEVDLGTDVFAFKDDREEVVRLQVKACTTPHIYADGSGYSAKFGLPMKQLRRPDNFPPLYYVLAVLREDRWVDFLVMSWADMWSSYNGGKKFGSYNRKTDDLEITVEFRAQVKCSGQDLSLFRNTWDALPPLQPANPGETAPDEAGIGGTGPGNLQAGPTQA